MKYRKKSYSRRTISLSLAIFSRRACSSFLSFSRLIRSPRSTDSTITLFPYLHRCRAGNYCRRPRAVARVSGIFRASRESYFDCSLWQLRRFESKIRGDRSRKSFMAYIVRVCLLSFSLSLFTLSLSREEFSPCRPGRLPCSSF